MAFSAVASGSGVNNVSIHLQVKAVYHMEYISGLGKVLEPVGNLARSGDCCGWGQSSILCWMENRCRELVVSTGNIGIGRLDEIEQSMGISMVTEVGLANPERKE